MCRYVVGVDPAGKGYTGIVIYDREVEGIIHNISFESDDWEMEIDFFATELNSFKKRYEKQTGWKFDDVVVVIEDFYLAKGQNITDPLSTPKAIGGMYVVVTEILDWEIVLQQPSVKNKINKTNYPVIGHELDAYKHILYYLSKN